MDSGAYADLCGKLKDSSCLGFSKRKDESFGGTVEVNNDVSKLPEVSDCLVPITPDTFRENVDFPIDLLSPLTVGRKQLKLASIDSETNVSGNENDNGSDIVIVDNGSPRTPKDVVFDPFAPGPDNMARAPQSKKYLDEARINVARQLTFIPAFDDVEYENSGDDTDSLSDQDMFESVYENLLEIIVSKQTEGVLAESPTIDIDSDDCITPPSALQFSGISDTCPGAPVKPAGKPRNIPVGLCKKLEF